MSNWIKCSDRLPPIHQKVLAYRLGKKTNDGPFFAMTCGNEHRSWRYIDGDRCDITPTHWQPLPAPPVAEQDAKPSVEFKPQFLGYDECRCILTQYCDGTCRPIFSKPPTE